MLIWGNILGAGILLGINRKIIFFSITMFVFIILTTLLCAWIVERKNMLIKIEIIILYYTILALLDFFCGFISMEMIGKQFWEEIYKFSQSMVQCALFLIPRAGVALLLAKWQEKSLVLEGDRKTLALLCVVFLGILKIYRVIMMNMAIDSRKAQGLGAAVSMGVVAALTAGVFVLFNRFQMLKTENEMLLELGTLSKNHIKEMEIMMEKNRIQTHDIKHHLLILREYGQERKWDMLMSYLNELSDDILVQKKAMWTQVGILDTLLEQKKAKAESKGIAFRIRADRIGELPFSDMEISTLFSNLLDNAIEACEKIQDDRRWIQLNIMRKSGMLYITISNSIKGRPLEKEGKLITNKQNHQLHGYGIKSVQKIVRKYEGDFSYQIRESEFIVTITFWRLEERNEI
ncbi:sensor histidine kinase [Pseudoflavonifractor sp. BSD2780061688st1 E11]|uniref:sensor histidine kinase n=1 Tax=Oscillospiraceae TaxID=216572 RepID=UPI001485626C|nr:sensor histidine kinase [Pseudoflavonifractor sp. BSD2780061688st1 E11]